MDYFNEDERAKQAAFAAKRDGVFLPVVRLLVRAGVTPAQVSILGVLFAAAILAVPPGLWGLSLALLALYLLMDGIDGPLARHTDTQSKGGSLIDIFADQVGVIIVAVAAVQWLGANPVIQVGFGFFYIMCVFLMVLANELGLTFRSVLRVKYVYFALYVVCAALGQTWPIEAFAGVFLAYYLYYFFTFFAKIVERLK